MAMANIARPYTVAAVRTKIFRRPVQGVGQHEHEAAGEGPGGVWVFRGLTYVERAGEFPQRPGRLSYIYGLALHETNLPSKKMGEEACPNDPGAARRPGLPPRRGVDREHVLQPGYDHDHDHEFGIDLILDGLERPAAQPDPLSHRDSPPK